MHGDEGVAMGNPVFPLLSMLRFASSSLVEQRPAMFSVHPFAACISDCKMLFLIFFFFTVCRRWRLRRQETNVYKDLLPLTAALLPLARREEENIALEKNEKADMKTSQTVEIDLTFKVNCLLFLFTLPRKVSMLPPIPSNILYKKM